MMGHIKDKEIGRISIIIFTLVAICACTSSKKQSEEPRKDFADIFELSDYVYIDNSGCLHVSKDCLVLTYGTEEGEKPNYQVRFVETKKLTKNSFNSMCSKCVSSKSFKELERIITFNGATGDYDEESDSIM